MDGPVGSISSGGASGGSRGIWSGVQLKSLVVDPLGASNDAKLEAVLGDAESESNQVAAAKLSRSEGSHTALPACYMLSAAMDEDKTTTDTAGKFHAVKFYDTPESLCRIVAEFLG